MFFLVKQLSPMSSKNYSAWIVSWNFRAISLLNVFLQVLHLQCKKDKTTLLVKLLTKSFYPFWLALYVVFLCMNYLMLFKDWRSWKCFLASLAPIRLFASMSSFMVFEVMRKCKCLLANFTLIWFFPCMNHFMPLEVI